MTTTKDEILKEFEEMIEHFKITTQVEPRHLDENKVRNWLESKLSSLSTHIRGEMVEELIGLKEFTIKNDKDLLNGGNETTIKFNKKIDDIISKYKAKEIN